MRLAQLKRGDLVQMNIPAAICKGVVLAEFDIQVTGAGSGREALLRRPGTV